MIRRITWKVGSISLLSGMRSDRPMMFWLGVSGMMPDWEVLTTRGAVWLTSLAWGDRDSLIDFWERKFDKLVKIFSKLSSCFKRKVKKEISSPKVGLTSSWPRPLLPLLWPLLCRLGGPDWISTASSSSSSSSSSTVAVLQRATSWKTRQLSVISVDEKWKTALFTTGVDLSISLCLCCSDHWPVWCWRPRSWCRGAGGCWSRQAGRTSDPAGSGTEGSGPWRTRCRAGGLAVSAGGPGWCASDSRRRWGEVAPSDGWNSRRTGRRTVRRIWLSDTASPPWKTWRTTGWGSWQSRTCRGASWWPGGCRRPGWGGLRTSGSAVQTVIATV